MTAESPTHLRRGPTGGASAGPGKDGRHDAEAFVFYGAVLILHDRIRRQSMHAHRPFEIIAAIEGRFRYRIATCDIMETDELLVPPMVPHAILGCEGRLARIYIDPGMRRILSWHGHEDRPEADGRVLLSNIRSFFDSDRPVPKAKALIADWRASWMGEINSAPLCDPRVSDVLAFLDDQALPTADRQTVAKHVGLSSSRLAAIFAAETGMPLRRYITWRRTLLAARLIREGETVTQSAVQAGFSDNAHLTRTYRAIFGSKPSDLKSVKIAQPTSRRHEPHI